ncbi:YheC/YheD family protein [Saccharibacillus sp. CPCC 101409]|uniref:YheC/YheD family protein n=1 Tax=Saccharibacillus sp. CPCC 101409 TaxID=3058041 RepID=UPI00267278E1|nr:YheC/YheD family protein [Saccharibacillus sp. CPCC 101409]MDO3410016.1 YheC/YheD family protein [Saccharibacillus sp. CPCC 101409]
MLLGVYHRTDPLEAIGRERIQAMIEEARRQDMAICFFDAEGIDLQRGTVTALHPHEDQFHRRETPYPDIVLNEWPELAAGRPQQEKELRKLVPFVVHLIGGKKTIYDHLRAEFGELLLPTERLDSSAQAVEALERCGDIVVKPSGGRRGEGILRVRAEGEGYRLDGSDGESRLLSREELDLRINEIAAREELYLVQAYRPVLTPAGEPLDFRVHVQRDEHGEFRVTRTYARAGRPGAVTSNLSGGGRSPDLEQTLIAMYGEDRAGAMREKLETTALKLAEAVNRPYSFLINELGIDLLMNEKGELHFLEANTAPETRDHEALRVVRLLGFCRHMDDVRRGRIRSRRSIGLLILEKDEEFRLYDALAFASAAHEADFFYFRASDAAFASPLIKALVFRGGGWEAQYRRPPDVVYDRLKERGLQRSEKAYLRLEGIPNTHSRLAGSFSKLKAYEMLSGDPDVDLHLIPYAALDSAESALEFIDRHGQSVIKPSGGTKGSAIVVVRKEGRKYRVDDPLYSHLLPAAQLTDLLRGLAQSKDMVLQKFIDSVTPDNLPFHIRVHLARNAEGELRIIGHMPYISTQQRHKVVNHHSNLRAYTQWQWFTAHQFPGREADMQAKIERAAYTIANRIEERMEHRLWEIGLDLGIEQDDSIWLYEANMNKVGVITRELELAKVIVPSCIRLMGTVSP